VAQLRKIDTALSSFNRFNPRKAVLVEPSGVLSAARINNNERLVGDWIAVAVSQLELNPMIFIQQAGSIGYVRDASISRDWNLRDAGGRLACCRLRVSMKIVVTRETGASR
jgi:hypothetical protein